MGKLVAQKSNLLSFFDTASKTIGELDSEGNIYKRYNCDGSKLLRDRWSEDGSWHFEEVQPIPSIPLYQIKEQAFDGFVNLSNWVKTPDLLCSDEPINTTSKATFRVEIWRIIGLALGERNHLGIIGPMFSGKPDIKAWVMPS